MNALLMVTQAQTALAEMCAEYVHLLGMQEYVEFDKECQDRFDYLESLLTNLPNKGE